MASNSIHLLKTLKKMNKKRANCTAPKKLDTIWGYFYGTKSQVQLCI